MPLTLKLTGADNLVARLVDLRTARLKKSTEDNIRQICIDIRDTAKAKAPVDTGSLQASIRLQTYHATGSAIIKLGVSAGGYVTNPRTGRIVNYARFVEYGTSRMRAQPYMRPAIEQHKSRLPKMYRGRRI